MRARPEPGIEAKIRVIGDFGTLVFKRAIADCGIECLGQKSKITDAVHQSVAALL